MANLDVMYSSKSDEWATPQAFFDEINKEFNFNLDPCSTDENHKCEKYFTKAENGLEKNWGGYRVFCNPPYSEISKWVDRLDEIQKKIEVYEREKKELEAEYKEVSEFIGLEVAP